jgi:hypothetical protein
MRNANMIINARENPSVLAHRKTVNQGAVPVALAVMVKTGAMD